MKKGKRKAVEFEEDVEEFVPEQLDPEPEHISVKKHKKKKKKSRSRSKSPSKSKSNQIDLSFVDAKLLKGLTEVAPGNSEALCAEELESEETEIFLVQCPKGVNLQEVLEGRKIKLNDKSCTSLSDSDGQSYEAVTYLADENEKTLTTVLPDQAGIAKVVSSRLSGQIVIKVGLSEEL